MDSLQTLILHTGRCHQSKDHGYTARTDTDRKRDGIKYLLLDALPLEAVHILAVILYVFLSQGQRIIQKLGPVGNQIINKLVAFFTFCIGIQISVTGISQIFHLNIL